MKSQSNLRVFLTAHISLLIRTAAVLHAASSTASPAVAAVVIFALAAAIRRAVVSHCDDWRLREKCLLGVKKSIRKVIAAAACTCGEAPSREFLEH